MTQTSPTLAYYDQHAAAYAEMTRQADMAASHRRLLERLRPGAHILDAGCGAGRDSLAFLQRGFRVTAFDGSAGLVQEARKLTGLPVELLRFEDMAFTGQFDAVWASASLLHLEPAALTRALTGLWDCLKPEGWLFASFKHGSGPRTEAATGRFFNDMAPARLEALVHDTGGLVVELHQSQDVLGRPDGWLSVLAQPRG